MDLATEPNTVTDRDSANDPDRLRAFIRNAARLFVLTGAGCSTESGIPDYRGPNGTLKHHRPMLFAEFCRSAANRRRYWARSYVGWPRMASAKPNAAHAALAGLESAGRVHRIVTQNVDGLHARAGSRDPIELHGTLARVVCLACGAAVSRGDLQQQLADENPAWTWEAPISRPDGDVAIPDATAERFHVPACHTCGGTLKPDVVFFGESVPRPRVDAALAELDAADGMLVVGSSLMVWSGYRFARAAAERGIPIAILNIGPTRADELATLRIAAKCGEILPKVV